MEKFANATEFTSPITLTAGIDAVVTTIAVSVAAPVSLHGGQFRIRVGDEFMVVTAGQDGTSWTVSRGAEGSAATTHVLGAPVKHRLTAAVLTDHEARLAATDTALSAEATARGSADSALDGRLTSVESSSVAFTLPIGQVGSIPKSIASRCGVNVQAGGISGTTTGETLDQSHLCLANCDGIRFAYSNCFGGGRSYGTTPIMVRASIVDQSGHVHQVTFDGEVEKTIQPGVTVISDAVGVGLFAGTRFRSRTFVKVTTNGDQVPSGAVTKGSPYSEGAASGDVTMSAGPTFTVDANYHFGPSAIFADYTDAECIVGLLLDSITAGQNDANANADQAGWALRALNGQWPYLQLSIPGDGPGVYRPPYTGGPVTSRKPRAVLSEGVTHWVVLAGTNGLDSSTLAQMQDNLLACWRPCAMRGAKVIACTLMPSGVTSTDGFVTLGNQTISTAANTVRVALNNWIRGGAPIDPATGAATTVGAAGALVTGMNGHPLYAYWELADTVESSRDSGKWGGAWTDGTHPNATGAALAAAGADLTKLGPKAPGAVTPVAPTTPASIFGASLAGWYRASSITGKVDADAIASWVDDSGNSRTLLQATGSKQPLYKTNINYSRPAVRFDGTDDFMAATFPLSQPFEIFIVAKLRSASSAAARMLVSGQGGAFNSVKYGPGTPSATTMYAGTNLASGADAAISTAWHEFMFSFNGTSSVGQKDGAAFMAGNAGSAAWTALTVAADGNGVTNADLDVQEIVVVLGRVSTAPERALMHAYFVSTYATP